DHSVQAIALAVRDVMLIPLLSLALCPVVPGQGRARAAWARATSSPEAGVLAPRSRLSTPAAQRFLHSVTTLSRMGLWLVLSALVGWGHRPSCDTKGFEPRFRPLPGLPTKELHTPINCLAPANGERTQD